LTPKNVKAAKAAPAVAGDVWTWAALDADSKLIVSYMVGTRDPDAATEFMHDMAYPLANRAQLTTDGHAAYFRALGRPAWTRLRHVGQDLRVQPGECEGSPQPGCASRQRWRLASITWCAMDWIVGMVDAVAPKPVRPPRYKQAKALGASPIGNRGVTLAMADARKPRG
jgi:hypothetical protein